MGAPLLEVDVKIKRKVWRRTKFLRKIKAVACVNCERLKKRKGKKVIKKSSSMFCTTVELSDFSVVTACV